MFLPLKASKAMRTTTSKQHQEAAETQPSHACPGCGVLDSCASHPETAAGREEELLWKRAAPDHLSTQPAPAQVQSLHWRRRDPAPPAAQAAAPRAPRLPGLLSAVRLHACFRLLKLPQMPVFPPLKDN